MSVNFVFLCIIFHFIFVVNHLLSFTNLSYITTLRLLKIKEWIDKNDPGAVLIPFSGAFELAYMDVPDEDKTQFLADKGATR